MTLGDFFQLIAENPVYPITFFTIIPFTAFVAGILGKNEGHISPWKYLYSTLIYLVCVPGIFAFTLNVYKFLFERGSVMDLQMFTQILPILSMIVTLLIIRNNVSLDRIPGHGKLSGLIMMILVLFVIMWFLEKTHVIVFSYMPIQYFLLLLVGLLLVFRFGFSRMMKA